MSGDIKAKRMKIITSIHERFDMYNNTVGEGVGGGGGVQGKLQKQLEAEKIGVKDSVVGPYINESSIFLLHFLCIFTLKK